MSVKVKRGLGLLVVALLALGVQWLTATSTPRSTTEDVVMVLAGAVLLVSAATGLVLVAWGLLRD